MKIKLITKMDICIICDEKYTNVRKKKIICPNDKCEKSCCVICFKKYLISSDNPEPKCMFCNNDISYSFIRKKCNSDFCNKDLHEKKTDVEMKRQFSLLPATQDLASLEIEREKFYKELELYDQRIMELRREIAIIDRQKQQVPYPRLIDIKGKSDNKITFIQRCPISECNGFLSSSWKCGICENYICGKCLKQKKGRDDPEHVCNENDVSSVAAIKKDSKPCPECATYIFKIDGCDQMWCPECKTAFSWKTGKIEKGTIHNPHYFQYMRETDQVLERQPGDLPPCEILPNFALINQILHRWKHQSTEFRNKRITLSENIINLVRVRRHVQYVPIRRYTFNYDDEFTKMRVDFLLKRIDEEKMFQKVKKLIKLKDKNTEFLQIYNLFLTVSGEILKNLIQMIELERSEKDIEEEFKKIHNIVKYSNNELWILRNSFKNEAILIETKY